MKDSTITVTDLFCGAGGSSLGAAASGAEIKLGLNHWRLAIETHNTNFPDADHDCVDISVCNPRYYPSTRVMIASPECTNHSLARGRKRERQPNLFNNGKRDPAAERSRATMWDIPRFTEIHDYDLIVVENVIEARTWQFFPAWLHAMRLANYEYKILYINSMFVHPTPQSRDRIYVIFWKKKFDPPDLELRPTAYCPECDKRVGAVQSWRNHDRPWGRWRRQYDYRCPWCAEVVTPFYYAAFNVINWSNPGKRIGDRKRPLKPRTIERIEYGLEKFSRQILIVETAYTYAGAERVTSATIESLPTQTTRQTMAIAVPHWRSPREIMQGAVDQYQMDKWRDQDFRLEVWIEKDALVGVIAGICKELDVAYFSCRGYASASEVWRAGQRLARYKNVGQDPIILHLGDHDPSGIDMTRDIEKRLSMFGGYGITVERIALNMDQVEQYNPPPNPAKVTDSRFNGYAIEFGQESWELDALEPQVMVELVRDAVLAYRNPVDWAEKVVLEDKHRAMLQQVTDDMTREHGF